MEKCQCQTAKGTPCKNTPSHKAGKDTRYCHVHQSCQNPIQLSTSNKDSDTQIVDSHLKTIKIQQRNLV
jgi:hypothetical protein